MDLERPFKPGSPEHVVLPVVDQHVEGVLCAPSVSDDLGRQSDGFDMLLEKQTPWSFDARGEGTWPRSGSAGHRVG